MFYNLTFFMDPNSSNPNKISAKKLELTEHLCCTINTVLNPT